jgi:hypothetical protein
MQKPAQSRSAGSTNLTVRLNTTVETKLQYLLVTTRKPWSPRETSQQATSLTCACSAAISLIQPQETISLFIKKANAITPWSIRMLITWNLSQSSLLERKTELSWVKPLMITSTTVMILCVQLKAASFLTKDVANI